MDTLKEITNLAESLKVKTCTKCGKTKHSGEININQSWCNLCINTVKKKTCSGCGETKSINHYYKNGGRKCKKCICAEKKIYRIENREKIIERYNNRPDVIERREKKRIRKLGKKKRDIERKRKYYEANKEAISAKRKAEYDSKPEVVEKRKNRDTYQLSKKEAKAFLHKKYMAADPDKYKAYYKKAQKKRLAKNPNVYKEYRIRNLEKVREKDRARAELLSDAYIRNRIVQYSNLEKEDITPEMIEIKRAQITLKRLIAQQ